MKKVFESELRGFSESASKIYVYEFEDEQEVSKFFKMEHDELCDIMGVYEEYYFEVDPGARYHRYAFDMADGFLVMMETIALNV